MSEDIHKIRMARKKQVIDNHIEQADKTKGLLLVNTGNGKGKSSSAFGMVARALGHGMKVGVVQFIKGEIQTGEDKFFAQIDDVDFHVTGEGYTWETQNQAQDRRTAASGWSIAQAMLANEQHNLVVLDELNTVLKLGLLKTDTVLADIHARPKVQHVICTGRGAPQALIELADTVTEMREVKHAYQAGFAAQKGIEL